MRRSVKIDGDRKTNGWKSLKEMNIRASSRKASAALMNRGGTCLHFAVLWEMLTPRKG